MNTGERSEARLFNQEFKLRVISALVLAAIVLSITWIGGYTFSLLWAFVAFAIFFEFRNICRSAIPAIIGFTTFAAIALVVAAYFVQSPLSAYWMAGIAFLVLVIWELFTNRTAWASLGLVYSVLPFFAMSEIRGAEFSGFIAVLVLFGCVWGADVMAFFFGRLIGGPKLAPRISPKKTWSGFIGSLIGGIGIAVLVDWVAGNQVTFFFVLLVFVITLLSQIGDLAESVLKRMFDVKDSGSLIPGHGGILDRIDGLIPAAVFLWIVLLFISSNMQVELPLGDVFKSTYLLP